MRVDGSWRISTILGRASGHEVPVQLRGLLGDRGPGEGFHGAACGPLCRIAAARRVGDQRVDALERSQRRTCAGSRGAPVPSSPGSIGTRNPVSSSTTTSTMPPVAVATTAASHAIASRLTIPSGS